MSMTPIAFHLFSAFPVRFFGKGSPKLWMLLVNTGRVDAHLTSIEREAERRIDTLLLQMMKTDGVTEELKDRDQMAWV